MLARNFPRSTEVPITTAVGATIPPVRDWYFAESVNCGRMDP